MRKPKAEPSRKPVPVVVSIGRADQSAPVAGVRQDQEKVPRGVAKLMKAALVED